MHDDRLLVENRIKRQLRERVVPAAYGPAIRLNVTALHIPGEPITREQAEQATFEPFAVGNRWGLPWSTTWFRLTGTVPDDFVGRRVEAFVDLGGGGGPGFTAEALVWGDEGPRLGLHPDHKTLLIAESARGGEVVDVLIEAAANPDFSASFQPNPYGDRATAPEHPLYRLARADLVVRNDDVWHLVHDLKVLAFDERAAD